MALADSLAPRKWDIYKITNPNGRVYIGKTCDFVSRKRCYKNQKFKRQPLIERSIAKYGFDNHSFEVIDSFISDNTYANGKEKFWIRTYMSFHKMWPEQNGMNMTLGGGGTLGVKKSKEFVEMIRNRFLGKKLPPEQVAKMHAHLRGHKFNVGRKCKEETKQKLSQLLKGRKKSPESLKNYQSANLRTRGKPIAVYNKKTGELIGEFAAYSLAAKYLGITKGAVEKNMRGEHTSFKYIFKSIQNGS